MCAYTFLTCIHTRFFVTGDPLQRSPTESQHWFWQLREDPSFSNSPHTIQTTATTHRSVKKNKSVTSDPVCCGGLNKKPQIQVTQKKKKYVLKLKQSYSQSMKKISTVKSKDHFKEIYPSYRANTKNQKAVRSRANKSTH